MYIESMDGEGDPEGDPVFNVLIVEDEASLGRSLRRTFGHWGGHAEVVETVEAATEAYERRQWSGFLVDLMLPNGDGMDVVRYVRERDPTVPVLVVTGMETRRLVNEAHALRAEFVFKPASMKNYQTFISQMIANEVDQPASLMDTALSFAECAGLSEGETRLLVLSVSGVGREKLADRLLVSENTVKTQVRRMLRKTGARSVSDVVQRVLRTVHRP